MLVLLELPRVQILKKMDKLFDYLHSCVIWKPCGPVHRLSHAGRSDTACTFCGKLPAFKMSCIRIPINALYWRLVEESDEYIGISGKWCKTCASTFLAEVRDMGGGLKLQRKLLKAYLLLPLQRVVEEYLVRYYIRCPLCK